MAGAVARGAGHRGGSRRLRVDQWPTRTGPAVREIAAEPDHGGSAAGGDHSGLAREVADRGTRSARRRPSGGAAGCRQVLNRLGTDRTDRTEPRRDAGATDAGASVRLGGAVGYTSFEKLWRVAHESPHVPALQRELGCSRLVAHLLTQRGLLHAPEARRFLDPSYEHLADPILLPDALPAIRRLTCALDRHERIYIHGDYDGDGVTAAALWTRLLEMLGGDVKVHVPHRRHDGYDFRTKFVETAREAGAKLIVTADCGIQRHREVEAARQAGIDVIITDHHEVGEDLPNAVAVVDPHRRDSQYPFRDLAAVGVAYRLGEALVRFLDLPVGKYRTAFGELAAIGTITDIMPLLGDNRVIVRAGLAGLGCTRRIGLRALMNQAGLSSSRAISSHQVGFVIGPRLNAVGRVADPRKALDLLLTRDADLAVSLASDLEDANVERRQEEARILTEAEARLDLLDTDSMACFVLDDPTWHPGVIGVVANRLCERHCRPTILVATDPDTGLGRGSGRSVGAFDLHAALTDCGGLLTEFGGHAYAAGFSIETGNIV
ncbi:MAG: single-stranded-DNA-specific exonuclease RecJ, partial [Armatimonadetes bacterium]|nr:single-stranded-DNA-specific exonuclease RecJ [Armatimonadota bacterium]